MSAKNSRELTPKKLQGKYKFIYMGGRILQGFGLLLIWWTLLLFANADNITIVLYGGFFIAVIAFYLGLFCIKWSKRVL